MNPIPPLRSNLAHLHSHDEHLLRLGILAERYFAGDPNTSLLKPRQLAEVLAQLAASNAGLFGGPEEIQFELLSRLRDHAVTPSEAHQLFSEIPRTGNPASHALPDDHRTALAIHFNEAEIRLLIDEQLRQPGRLPDSQKTPLHTRGSPREGQTQGHCRVAHRHRAGGLRAFCRANPNGAGQGEAEELRCRRLPEPGQTLQLRLPPLRRNPASRSKMTREWRIPPPFAFSTSGRPLLRQLATRHRDDTAAARQTLRDHKSAIKAREEAHGDETRRTQTIAAARDVGTQAAAKLAATREALAALSPDVLAADLERFSRSQTAQEARLREAENIELELSTRGRVA
jgi:hypothetical protein